MYNKLFTKILDSSIWLEPDTTRLVWLTLIASMDQDGFAQFAGVANLAHRAVVSVDAAEQAVAALSAPDKNSSNPAHKGRRIERVPGGWMVINAQEYQKLVTREINRRNTKERVRAFREKARKNALTVTGCNESVTHANAAVTPSDADADVYTDAQSKADEKTETKGTRALSVAPPRWSPAKSRNGHHRHAWCSPRDGLCVPDFLHTELLGKSAKPEPELRAWYQHTLAKFDGRAIGEDSLQFWRNEFAAWVGTVTQTGKPVRIQKPPTMHNWREDCQKRHAGRCENVTFHAAMVEDGQ